MHNNNKQQQWLHHNPKAQKEQRQEVGQLHEIAVAAFNAKSKEKKCTTDSEDTTVATPTAATC